ncbi:hypothetical protein MMC13_008260 [Lambiella insularis]|nr:hypothetical protein [Lambiella insularis]
MADPLVMELLSSKALQSVEQMQLLDVVDSLRAQGLSEFTALPQLIVCGDQSSGKSSVLESISGVPFPRQDNLCTRHATEVILRRDATDEISVSIVPAKDRLETDANRLLEFHHILASRKDFQVLFDKAKDAMGLSDTLGSFSRDVLRVEIRGPTQPQLTPTKHQTKDDVELVKQLVTGYMNNPRSIILAVVSAKNDIGNQAVLERAREVDPLGLRTLGIITKPDTLHKGSSNEAAFLNLARNENIKLQLGWHVVRNLDFSTTSSQDTTRDETEVAFFTDSNFKNLPPQSIGIATLRTRLSKVLFNHIRAELPRLGDEINEKIRSYESDLKKIGAGRSTAKQQRAFLIELSQLFQTTCRDAIQGNYDNAFFHNDAAGSENRLCAAIMNMHFEFAEKLRKNGARWIISNAKDADNEKSRSRGEAIDAACVLLKKSRGRELLGLPNPRLVGELFREYSSPWEDLAREHIKKVWEYINKFIEGLLLHQTDTVVADSILRIWLQPIMEQRLTAAYEELEKLVAVHKEEPMTLNHYFLDNVKKRKQRDIKDDFEERLRKKFVEPDQTLSISDVAAIMASVNPGISPDMDLVAAEDAFDNMQAFYKVAMKTFMDNVPTLAIRAHIVLKVPSMLCPTSVYSMDAELVAKIAGESEERTSYREDLQRKLATLKTGANICKQHAVRSHIPARKPTNSPALSNGVSDAIQNGTKTTVSGRSVPNFASPTDPPVTPQNEVSSSPKPLKFGNNAINNTISWNAPTPGNSGKAGLSLFSNKDTSLFGSIPQAGTFNTNIPSASANEPYPLFGTPQAAAVGPGAFSNKASNLFHSMPQASTPNTTNSSTFFGQGSGIFGSKPQANASAANATSSEDKHEESCDSNIAVSAGSSIFSAAPALSKNGKPRLFPFSKWESSQAANTKLISPGTTMELQGHF